MSRLHHMSGINGTSSFVWRKWTNVPQMMLASLPILESKLITRIWLVILTRFSVISWLRNVGHNYSSAVYLTAAKLQVIGFRCSGLTIFISSSPAGPLLWMETNGPFRVAQALQCVACTTYVPMIGQRSGIPLPSRFTWGRTTGTFLPAWRQ